jgi:hypothetical protein
MINKKIKINNNNISNEWLRYILAKGLKAEYYNKKVIKNLKWYCNIWD